MKVLLINGSPHARGCTATALGVVADVLEQNGIETEMIHVGLKDVRGCIGCDFLHGEMPIASSRYWNMVHGNTTEEVLRDEEGLQTMRVLGRNMAFLIRAIARERDAAGLPETEPTRITTNFIR